ncbi:MAG: 16S rRNA (guanine(966)-N(2))-methyltransferase RsmD [Thermotogae bacterium]|nr:16S rRNA (guanine(966)-N(2))-methyltransferase RsmD [Thermotogota bacterium]
MKKTGLQVSGGKFKGIKLKTPKRIRPTSSFTRKRIYDILGNISGYKVLDLFSGSGALGIEALSRGAESCVFVDSSGASVRIIRENLRRLNLMENTKVVKADVLLYLRTASGVYDLILADPPYTWDRKLNLLKGVEKFLEDGGVLVLEMSARERPPETSSMRLFKLVKGGDTAVAFYRKVKMPP